MRLTPLISAALVVSISGPSYGQEWVEYANREDRFTCNFPSQPKVTETIYRSEHGADLPARVYSNGWPALPRVNRAGQGEGRIDAPGANAGQGGQGR
jgi:hypothetical protein